MMSADFAMFLDGDIPLVIVKGAIDSNNVAALKIAIDCVDATGATAIVVVLETTEYVCAQAYGILAATCERVTRENRSLLVVCKPNNYARRIMTLLELKFPLFDSVPEALAAARLSPLRQ
jgi:anti-anti-sigma factor